MEEILSKYEKFKIRIIKLRIEIEELDEAIDTIRSTSGGECIHGSGISNPTEDKAVRLSDKKKQLISEIEAMTEQMDEVCKLINMLPSQRKQLILTLRYISCEHDFAKIGQRLDKKLCGKQVRRLHDKAVAELNTLYCERSRGNGRK